MQKIIFIILFIFVNTLVYSQKVHLILVSATNDPSIGQGCQSNHNSIKRIANQIKDKGDISLNIIEILGDNVNSTFIDNKLNAITCTSDDVIWFYYSGHGVNSGNTIWPKLLISGSKELYLDKIHEKLKTKKARLTITIGDCCNFVAGFDAKNLFYSPKVSPEKQNIEKLFLTAKGDYLVSSSKKGQISTYCPNVGGYFTSAFSDIWVEFLSASNTKDINWQSYLLKTQLLTIEIAKAFQKQQTPQYLYADKISYNIPNNNQINNPISNENNNLVQNNTNLEDEYWKDYTIVSGDGFYIIAGKLLEKHSRKQFSKEELAVEKSRLASQIAAWNNLTLKSTILAGKKLKINMSYFE